MVEWSHVVMLGFALIFLGVLLVFAGFFFAVLGKAEGGRVEGGGVILIGPIPIIFGTSTTLAIVASILAIIMIVLMLILMFLAPRIWGGG